MAGSLEVLLIMGETGFSDIFSFQRTAVNKFRCGCFCGLPILWFWCYYAKAIIVCPLVPRVYKLIHEKMVRIKHYTIGCLFLSLLWVFMDFRYSLVNDDNRKDLTHTLATKGDIKRIR
uniref:Uncharacterized protein n=1 Tax=Corethron hystrix TaxID=216773 RepID=A0A7S1FMV9_9STRA|mmetsp:Transcript_16914/g.38058  ORF Transcript_16914/g.38058 Transcript_16914/m.38058 type:complete len:118 (+) Transcript_16914:392-745(+)